MNARVEKERMLLSAGLILSRIDLRNIRKIYHIITMIKNNTPFLGKIRFKFEKNPNYTDTINGLLNKIHFSIGPIRFVSRLIPNIDRQGNPIGDPKKIKLINDCTGGIIGDYSFDGIVLNDHFISKDGKVLIGNLRDAWWYYKNNLVVCPDYPAGIAEVFEPTDFGNVICGYYGYTHRGGQTFKIGDRLFEEDYIPVPEDYSHDEWIEYLKSHEEGNILDKKNGYIKDREENPISDYIPFKRRGKKTIETWEEAKQAAINIHRYL